MSATHVHATQNGALKMQISNSTTNNMSTVDIQSLFISEAIAAKTLFADLAKVELYIAESYRTRAFIELLQNADDAGANRFLVRQFDNKLVVANNGRSFTEDDIMALCRSGASNKRRESGTIGYRGIGFKSVAGIATEIDVVSNEYAFRFSKSLTRKIIDTKHDVPLIRIPHSLPSTEPSHVLSKRLQKSEGMSTVFVLTGLNHRMVLAEAENFDISALLFLNNIRQIDIETPDVSRILKRTTTKGGAGYTIEKISAGETEKHTWLVAQKDAGSEKVAFALEDEKIVPAGKNVSVIHAFMPTTEFAGAYLKINGDFSTDPSRKVVDIDDLSLATIERSLDLLADMARIALVEKQLIGFFSPFIPNTPQEGEFRKLLRDGLAKRLSPSTLKLGNCPGTIQDIRLAPDWLPYGDYEVLCQAQPHIPMDALASYPELGDFLRWLGAKPLSLEEVIVLVQAHPISPLGCAQLVLRIARQFRYDLTADRLDRLMSTRLLPIQGDHLPAHKYSGQKLLPEFLTFLTQAGEIDDVRQLFKRLKLPDNLLGTSPRIASPTITQMAHAASPMAQMADTSLSSAPSKSPSLFKSPPAIKQWRSAEQNALVWLSALTDVLSVKDVSQANVGYDLEVIKHDGKRYYIEVKSVSRFGDPVRLTNNEHSTAFQLGKNYLLALVVNGKERFDIRFVPDPIRTLALEKRCEQWSWYCDDYITQLIELQDK